MGGEIMDPERIERQIYLTKRLFIISTLSLLVFLPISFFFNNLFINSLFLLSVALTGLIVGLTIVTFILYWIGWLYTTIKLFYYRNKKRKVQNDENIV